MAGQAGWYRAPGEDGLLRYWNGSAWTEHRQPAPVAVPVAAPVIVPVAITVDSVPEPVLPIPAAQAPMTQRHVATEPLAPQPTAVVAPAEPDWSMDQFEKQFEAQFGATAAGSTSVADRSGDAELTPQSFVDPISRFAPAPTPSPASVSSASEAIALPAAAPAVPAEATEPQKHSVADVAFAASTATADVVRVRRNRRRVMNPVRGMIGGLLFIIVGAALIFLATAQNNPPAGELKASGIVTSLGSPTVGCSPTARFAAAGGSYTTPIGAAMSPCPVQLGQSVNVFYTMQHPGTTGQISSPSSISTIDWAVTGIGVVLLLGSFILFVARAGSVSRGVAVIRDGELAEVAAAKNRP
jgi:hypothetical protein